MNKANEKVKQWPVAVKNKKIFKFGCLIISWQIATNTYNDHSLEQRRVWSSEMTHHVWTEKERFFKVNCLITPWQIATNTYNYHSPVHSSKISSPWQINENWVIVSSQRHKPVGFAVWRADVERQKTSVFLSVKALTGQSGTSKIQPALLPEL